MGIRLIKRQAALAVALAAMLWGISGRCGDIADLLKKASLSAYTRRTKPPEFTGRTATGGTLALSSLRGKVVVVNFWASWCEECRSEMPAFQRLHSELASAGLAVIGINANETLSVVLRYAHDLNLTFPLVLDTHGRIKESYGVIGLPTTFVVARDGRAVALAIGPRPWNAPAAKTLLAALLAAGAK